MLTLDEALTLLDEDDVDEVIVQSGQGVRALHGFTERAIPTSALSSSEIVGLLQAAQLQEIVPRHDTAGEEHERSVDGRDYRFRIARFLDLIELRISFAGDTPATPIRDATDASERTVIVTAPKGPKGRPNDPASAERRASKLGRLRRDYADPLPAPTRHPIGTEDPTVPLNVAPAGSGTPTRREGGVVGAATAGTPRHKRHRTPEQRAKESKRTDDAEPRADKATKKDVPIEVAPEFAPASPTMQVTAPQPSDAPRATAQPRAAVASSAAAAVAAPAAATLPTRPEAVLPALEVPTNATLAPVLAKVVGRARAAGASDVHLLSGQAPRVRTAGRLEPDGSSVDASELSAAVDNLLSPTQQRALQERGYVDLGYSDPTAGRLRLNVCRHRAGLKVCARLVAATPSTPTDLGLPWEVEAIANHHQGLVVCSGPSGAGKTTTMASLVHLFNERKAVHIITVEDPIEIRYPRAKSIVSQREVGTHTMSFRAALKGALREDPDIIVIGELRDPETVSMALSAAETGHLVLATMSTPSGAQTIGRLIDMFPPEDQSQVRATLAGALKLVVSQRLIDSADGQRRVAAFEVITGNVPLWSLIRDQKLHQLPSLLQRGRAYGMVRLEDSLRGLMLSQTITRAAAMANADDPKLLGGDDNAAPPSRRARGGSR